MKTLCEIVEQLGSFDEEQTIFLDRMVELSGNTAAMVAWIPEDDSHPEEAKGLTVFIDIWHAKEVIEGKARLAKIHRPTVAQQTDMLIDYAIKGA